MKYYNIMKCDNDCVVYMKHFYLIYEIHLQYIYDFKSVFKKNSKDNCYL